METEEERQARWKKRIEEMKRVKRRTKLLHRCGMAAAAVLAIAVGCGVGIGSAAFRYRDASKEEGGNGQLQGGTLEESDGEMTADDSLPDHVQQGDISGGADILDGFARIGEGAASVFYLVDKGGGIFSGGNLNGNGASSAGGALAGGGEGNPGGGLVGNGSNSGGDFTGKEKGNPNGGLDGNGEDSASGGLYGNGEGNSGEGLDGNGEDNSGEGLDGSGEGSPEDAVPVGAAGQAAAASVPVFEAHSNLETVGFRDNIISKYGVFIDVEDGVILAQKDATTRMNPASMTKILTVLVAAEHVTEADLDDTVPITIQITDYCYINDCSVTGYDRDEVVTVRDLFYGTILPSGADSALALASYVAGSHEAFVDMMNEKLEEMGLAETTHFANCVGLYDENHYSTAYDMAMILKTAADNAFCRDVLSAHTYRTSQTEQHPEGLLVSNWFLRRIEDKDTHGEVLCGKTGYVDQSGSCAASLCIGNDGKEYLCVTAGSSSSQNCIADQTELYQRFIPQQTQ